MDLCVFSQAVAEGPFCIPLLKPVCLKVASTDTLIGTRSIKINKTHGQPIVPGEGDSSYGTQQLQINLRNE